MGTWESNVGDQHLGQELVMEAQDLMIKIALRVGEFIDVDPGPLLEEGAEAILMDRRRGGVVQALDLRVWPTPELGSPTGLFLRFCCRWCRPV